MTFLELPEFRHAGRDYRSTVSDCITFEELTLEQLQVLYDAIPGMRGESIRTFTRWAEGDAFWGRSSAGAWFTAHKERHAK
jgi:hypothetical protein